MYKCTRCGTAVYQPKKTWKIKQTPVALLECPSCKTRWRSRLIETIAIMPITTLAVAFLNPVPENVFKNHAKWINLIKDDKPATGEDKAAVDTNPELASNVIYPHLVNENSLRMLERLKARISRVKKDDDLFLSYCGIHKRYYVDHTHTNEVIRCPICDEEWLGNHMHDHGNSQYQIQ